MISGLILVERGPEALAATLGSLVPAVVEGLVGDAVVIARQPDGAVAAIAEMAGAHLVIVRPELDPWRAGAALARREWVLCLTDGDVPGEGWMRAADRFFASATRDGRPLGRLSRRRAGVTAALLQAAEQWTGTRTVRPGDLVRRDWLQADRAARVRPVRIAAGIEREAI